LQTGFTKAEHHANSVDFPTVSVWKQAVRKVAATKISLARLQKFLTKSPKPVKLRTAKKCGQKNDVDFFVRIDYAYAVAVFLSKSPSRNAITNINHNIM
jgi:hypothetical protein